MSGSPPRRAPQPVPDTGLVVIDGDNLLHRVRGMRDEAGLHWLLPRLKAWRPPEVEILLMLDGSPGPGVGRRQQAAPGIRMQHSGRLDADTAIVDLVRAQGYSERSRTVVVTDDRQLTERARYSGVMVRRLDWLVDQLAARAVGVAPGSSRPPSQGSPARPPVRIGGGRPPRAPDATTPMERDPDVPREPWKPGRGATVKRGNPRRGSPPPDREV